MAYRWLGVNPPRGVDSKDWLSWQWQLKNSLKNEAAFSSYFELTEDEQKAFAAQEGVFEVSTTPYYASLASATNPNDPLRKILMPHSWELHSKHQQMLDPLGERKNNPAPRVIHRYPDRALFLVTDHCSVYCRYCTRKHFTGKKQSFPNISEYNQSLEYFKKTPQIREVILSGGDPLTLSDKKLFQVLSDLRSIPHIEIIRIGTRMPVVAPMRVTKNLVEGLQKFTPVYMMLHFNHPKEITELAANAISLLVDHGHPTFNQMVLLNGINNHPVLVQALNRRLLYLRCKPYYMFQCDPSEGTDHLRTSIEQSAQIQKELWGRLSGLAMSQLSVDIPNGGGKAGVVPNFITKQEENSVWYRGWDGVEAPYINPPKENWLEPDISEYQEEWSH